MCSKGDNDDEDDVDDEADGAMVFVKYNFKNYFNI